MKKCRKCEILFSCKVTEWNNNCRKWIELENIMFSEISHTQKDKFHVLFITTETTCKLDIHAYMCVLNLKVERML